MSGIPFTQFLRPNGRRASVRIERPEEIERAAEAWIAAGGWFECEELMSGHASLTACMVEHDEQQDVEIEVVMNGPAVPDAVDRLVRKTQAALARRDMEIDELPDDGAETVDCWQCAGEGFLEDCFEDTCVCLDPPCTTTCCDICRGKGYLPAPKEG